MLTIPSNRIVQLCLKLSDSENPLQADVSGLWEGVETSIGMTVWRGGHLAERVCIRWENLCQINLCVCNTICLN